MHLVLFRVDGHGANAKLCARPKHTNGDLTYRGKIPISFFTLKKIRMLKRNLTPVGHENAPDRLVLGCGGVEILRVSILDPITSTQEANGSQLESHRPIRGQASNFGKM